MQLLIDIGNTRTKWASEIDGVLNNHDFLENSVWLKQLEKNSWWPEIGLGGISLISQISFACVANEKLVQVLRDYCSRAGINLQRLESASNWNQLVNGYKDHSQMGVDRWLAMVAAWDSCNTACLVIDCGTAITVDAIDSEGKHLGGHIVAGLGILKQSLISETASIFAKQKLQNRQLDLAQNTSEAVEHGSLQMILDYIESSWMRFKDVNPEGQLFICGGDGALFGELLNYTNSLNKDLVLKGIYLESKNSGKTNND